MIVLTKRMALTVVVGCVLLFALLINVVAQAPVDDETLVRDYLAKLGWEVVRESLKADNIQIPEEFTPVYENYDMLQQEGGYDLEPYKGKTVKRVVYSLSNFEGDPNVISEVLVFNNNIIGGDLMDPSVGNGFMLPLLSREEINKLGQQIQNQNT